jgi:prepilin-type N-terminal cleavage/methylation domain-containing protein
MGLGWDAFSTDPGGPVGDLRATSSVNCLEHTKFVRASVFITSGEDKSSVTPFDISDSYAGGLIRGRSHSSATIDHVGSHTPDPSALSELSLKLTAPKRLRDGFTLVELLVVIAIAGILMSLLLAAVQASREAARRAECVNNVKQFGLAFHNHLQAHRAFPTGGWSNASPPTYIGSVPLAGARQQAGWGFQILPFIEADPIWKSGAVTAIATPQAVFFCPSRRAPQTASYLDGYDPPLTGGILTHALCDYAASNLDGTGAVRRMEPVRLKEIRDGTTHTLLVGEKRMNLAFLGQPQHDDNEGYTAGWDKDTMRLVERAPDPDFVGEEDGHRQFGSSHPGSFNAVFADSSVRSISYEVDLSIFRRLGNKADNEVVNLDNL